ncbi:hypothetical protein CAMGR0001_0027 [Campylobacter gracilis RM3268]|uniref:Uncharacterized protein n=1 Tax=Campylobacter gracilis RM3268 TaxID=553220 RepID=C8PI46_9BACT|nr:hypothetical protein CAMGR0001_0027 [Campylobacter gracilis RM3268]
MMLFQIKFRANYRISRESFTRCLRCYIDIIPREIVKF